MSRLKELLNREPIFINPYTDFGFKRLFGEETSKELLIDFVNQLLPDKHKIADVHFQNPEKQPNLKDERKAFFDIRCKTTQGETLILEMQKGKLTYFNDRAIYYITFPIQEQAQKGNWNFKLNPVYLIAILDFIYDQDKQHQLVLRNVDLRDQNAELFSDNLHLSFIQMPRFNKSEKELETQFDKWLYFLKNLETFDEIPTILNEPVFQKGFEIAKISNMKPVDYKAYIANRLAYAENKGVIDTAHDEGFAAGEAKGFEEGIEKGIEKGKIEGQQLLTRNLILNTSFTDEQIAQLVGVSLDFVQNVRKDLSAE